MSARIVPALQPGTPCVLYGDECMYLCPVVEEGVVEYLFRYRGYQVAFARRELLKLIDEGDLYPAA